MASPKYRGNCRIFWNALNLEITEQSEHAHGHISLGQQCRFDFRFPISTVNLVKRTWKDPWRFQFATEWCIAFEGKVARAKPHSYCIDSHACVFIDSMRLESWKHVLRLPIAAASAWNAFVKELELCTFSVSSVVLGDHLWFFGAYWSHKNRN